MKIICCLCLVLALFSPAHADELMTIEELTQTEKQLFEQQYQHTLETCRTVGESGHPGIEYTREACLAIQHYTHSIPTDKSGMSENFLNSEKGKEQLAIRESTADRIRELLQKAVDLDEPQAHVWLATMLEKEDPEMAKSLYAKAAEQGLPQAKYRLGMMRLNKKDFDGAMELFLSAAEEGNRKAMSMVAYTSLAYAARGEATEEEKQLGHDYTLQLAKEEYASAHILMMNHVYAFKDDYPWFINQAENGNANTYSLLGLMYQRGVGVEKDLEKAQYWYNKGVRSGSRIAGSRLYMVLVRNKMGFTD